MGYATLKRIFGDIYRSNFLKMRLFQVYKFIARITVLVLSISAQGAPEPKVDARLISEMTSVRAGESFDVALVQDIEPGWHTYWRNPGDSGAPTKIIWDLPEGFVAGDIQWPYPERVPYGPLVNYGYHDQVVFPIRMTAPDEIDGDTVTLAGQVEYLVCEDICIPEDAEVALTLPVSADAPSRDPDNAALFERARQRIPQDIGLDANYSVEGDVITVGVEVGGLKESRIESATYFPYEEGVIDNTHPQDFRLTDTGFVLSTHTGYDFDPNASGFQGIIVITEDSGEQLSSAFEVNPVPGAVASPGAASVPGLLTAIVFAFLGGVILNLMPCVFPVLSIKVLSLVGHGQSREVRLHGLLFVLGVVLSFLVVAGVLIALRAAGAQIGWGFQLQSPLVVGLLVYLFFVIGLMLSGYFTVGYSLMNLGDSLARSRGYTGSFLTGVLATIVAAPCTAPFMGAAIGFALTRDSVTALTIFGSLGLGMGLPYLVLCYSPALLRRLPRPGPWMETFKEFLAFPMFASAVWLMWVLSQQSGPTGVLFTLSGLVLIAFAMWLLKRSPGSVFHGIAGILIISALALPWMVDRPSGNEAGKVSGVTAPDSGSSGNGPVWEAWSPDKVARAREAGPVFVNFTAAWCITCKVNESVALNSQRVRDAFNEAGVTYLKGDWTNEDPEITRALAEYNRSGVPLYLMYPRGQGRAEVLPQILTESTILEAIEDL